LKSKDGQGVYVFYTNSLHEFYVLPDVMEFSRANELQPGSECVLIALFWSQSVRERDMTFNQY